MRATDVIGWFAWVINLFVWIMLILIVLLDGLLSFIQERGITDFPSFVPPVVGLVLDLIFQIIYATTYGYNRNLMKCWGYDYPQLGECSYIRGGI